MEKKLTVPYDKNLIGKLIAIGAENIVYRYHDTQVIKFPTFFSIRYLGNPQKYCAELQTGFTILKEHLKDNLNDSALHFYNKKNKSSYVIIEPFIDGKALQKKDLRDKNIESQFLEIIRVKSNLEEEQKMFLDLFGLWGLLFLGYKEIPNLLIEKETKKLYLVDIGTAQLNDDRFFIRLIVKWAKRRQNNLLKLYT